MEFWGVEVKSGEPVKVQPGEGMVVHLSQANIGEAKKDKSNESILLYVNHDGKKMVLGTLFSDKLPQQQFDLVFDKEFELSHNWKAGSVFFLGYKASNVDEDDEGFSSEEDEEEDIPLVANGKPEAKAKQEKPASAENALTGKGSAAGKQKVKIVEPNKDSKPDEDDGDSEDDDDSDEDMDSDSDGDDMEEGEDDSDSEPEDSDEDEETPGKVQSGKKRPASATKTPTTDKKAKVATPQKTDGKKVGGHVATPHPAKQTGKTPANKASLATPKSGGSFTCGSCKKSFGSDNALQSHTKAKHSAGK